RPPTPVAAARRFPPGDVAPSCWSTDSPRDFGAGNAPPRDCCSLPRRCRAAHFECAIPPRDQGPPIERPVRLKEGRDDGGTKATPVETMADSTEPGADHRAIVASHRPAPR